MSIHRPRGGLALAALLACALSACMHSPPQPLDPDAVLAAVQRERRGVAPETVLTLSEAVERMRRVDPAIRDARAAWRAAEALARVPTPLDNPTISFGPLLVGGTDILSNAALGVEAALGWAVPLSNARTLRDGLHRVQADAALARAAAVERAAYLALRGELVAAVLEGERVVTRHALEETAQQATEAGRRLAEAGQAGAVDVRLLDLEAARTRVESIAAEGEAEAQRHRLAARVGLRPEHVGVPDAATLPTLPDTVPPLDDLERTALAHHPQLAVLRADYLVAEKELRLEVADAMPDFEMGVGFENEAGALKLGLPFALEIPLWDRNQQGIVGACARRDAARVAYGAQLQRLLSGLATARARLDARRATRAVVVQRVEPASRKTLEAARAGLEAGTLDVLRYLEVLRAERAVALEILDARIAEHEAWLALEQAAGVPLLSFPGQPTAPAVAEESR